MRACLLAPAVAAALACVSSLATAEQRSGDQCLSGICLGDRLSALPSITWQAPDASASADQPDFPRYEPVIDPGSKALSDAFARASLDALLQSSLPPSSVHRDDPVDSMLATAIGLSKPNRQALRKEASFAGNAIALSPEGIAGLSRLKGVVFCSSAQFVGYFRSTSGHPTTVGFAAVAAPDGADEFIVDAIIRRIPTDQRAMDQLFSDLQKEHPSAVHDRDLTIECKSKLPCDPAALSWPGKSERPTDWTAAQNARLQLRDYFVRFQPVYDEVLVSLRLFSANSEPLMKSLRAYGLDHKPIASRIDRPAAAVCEAPPAAVPSIE